MSDAVQSQPQPHRAFAALRAPGYAAYLIGSAVAMMADAIEHVISYRRAPRDEPGRGVTKTRADSREMVA